MKTVKQYDPRVKTTYVYEVIESHYDPKKKQSRSTRRLIGKLDENGNLVETGKPGRPVGSGKKSGDTSSGERQHYEELLLRASHEATLKDEKIASLTEEIREVKQELKRYRDVVEKTQKLWMELS